MSNTIKEAFLDYNGNIDCEILNINLFKKSKKVEIYLKAEAAITLEELAKFERYLIDKFEVIKEITHIEYVALPANTIKKDWGKIIDYLSSKYPITKAILKESKVEVNKNVVCVILKTKNAEFMKESEFSLAISNLLSNLYGKSYQVEYKEEIDEAINKENIEYLEEVKKKVYKKTIEEIEERETKVISDNVIEEIKAANESETALILGRGAEIKNKIVNIYPIDIFYKPGWAIY